MSTELILTVVVFVMATSGFMLIFLLLHGRKARLEARLRGLSEEGTNLPTESLATSLDKVEANRISMLARKALPRLGTSMVPTNEGERTRLKSRLVYAGYYSQQAMPIFMGIKMLLMVAPALAGFVLGLFGIVTMRISLLGGACLGIVGMIGPSLWLDNRKANRQSKLRRALPDALDLLVICLEGGLSLQGALKRISLELKSAHPELAMELSIVQREIQLGRTPGESLQELGKRTDLEEINSLSAVITQSERFGASLVKSLRIHSDALRQSRQQRAEEMGQKAATKVLFPTLLFIFPAMFVVILGPAAIQIARTFTDMK